MNSSATSRLRPSAADGPSDDYAPVVRATPLRAAFGPVLSLVNPAPPVSRIQRMLQALAISTIGLTMVGVPFVALGVAATELDALESQPLPITNGLPAAPDTLPLASPAPSPLG